MQKYEKALGPLLDDVVCGRPEGHTGQCRSVQSLVRRRRYEKEWRDAINNRRRREQRRAQRLGEVLVQASEQARLRALGR